VNFKTGNSTYEVDWTNKLIRRLQGVRAPTPRQGEDGQWKAFASITPVLDGTDDGFFFFIDWDGEGHGTCTTVVQEITEDERA
jgi:hypothetical protein